MVAGDPDDWVTLAGVQKVDHAEAIERGFFAGAASLILELLVAVVVAIVGLIAAELVRATTRSTAVQASLRAGRLRRGRRSMAFADITFAKLIVGPGHARSLGLRFGNSRLELIAPLREGARVLLDPATRDLMATVLSESSVAIPTDRYDPKGKFARSGFPTHVTREEAIELVRSPPGPSDPLPIPGH